MEGHGAAERRAVVLVSLVVPIEHLHAADLSRFSIGLHFHTQHTLTEAPPQSLSSTLFTVMNDCRDIFISKF